MYLYFDPVPFALSPSAGSAQALRQAQDRRCRRLTRLFSGSGSVRPSFPNACIGNPDENWDWTPD